VTTYMNAWNLKGARSTRAGVNVPALLVIDTGDCAPGWSVVEYGQEAGFVMKQRLIRNE
jgi:hypothetical protein